MKLTPTPLMRLTDPNRPIMYGIVLPGPDVGDGVPIVKGGDVERDGLRRALLKKTTHEIEAPYARARLAANDLVITIRGSAGTVRRVPQELEGCNITQDVARIAPASGVVSSWLLYALSSNDAVRQLEERITGATVTGINIRDLKRVVVPVPNVGEQRRIADLLDARCAAIDAAIEKKERMLEAAEDRVASAIETMVRQGTLSRRKLVPVDAAWIDRLPEGWRIERNGALFDERDSRGEPHLPVLSVSLVSGVTLRDFSNDRIQPQMSDFAQYKVARRNDIVFNKMRMWQGAVGVAPVDGLVSPDYTVLRPRAGVDPHYYAAMFKIRAYTGEVSRYSHGIALDRNRIYWTEFKVIRSLVPPTAEQTEIAAAIGAVKDASTRLTTALTRSIAALREYRTALITAAVTGELDLPPAPTDLAL